MFLKFSNIFPLVLSILSAFLWWANLQIISWWVFTKELSYLWEISRQKVIKYVATSAKCKMLIMKLRVNFQLDGKSSGIWNNLSAAFEYVAENIFNFQQIPLVKWWTQKLGILEVYGSNLGHARFLVGRWRMFHIPTLYVRLTIFQELSILQNYWTEHE